MRSARCNRKTAPPLKVDIVAALRTAERAAGLASDEFGHKDGKTLYVQLFSDGEWGLYDADGGDGPIMGGGSVAQLMEALRFVARSRFSVLP